MAEEEEPKKKSGIVTILIFVVAGFILVAVGLGVGYLIFGGSNDTPQDIANEIVTKQNGDSGTAEEDPDCERDEDGECIEETDPEKVSNCLLYTSPSPRDMRRSRMPSSA